MKRDIAIEIIKDFHERGFPSIVDRDLEIRMPEVRKAVTVMGPRRAGKTYFLFNTMQRLRGVEMTEMLYLNLEDDRIYPPQLKDLDQLLKAYYEIYPRERDRRRYLFLDEVQNVDGWERFVRRVLDTENVQVFVTGSSSRLLAKEIATSMRGRAVSYLVLPFSFSEALRAKGVKSEQYLSSDQRARMMRSVDEFVKFGGFPEVVLEGDETSRSKTLKEYIDVMLMRDVIERQKVKNTKVLRMLFGSLMASFAKEFSIHKFFRFLKSQRIDVSKNTLYEYVQHFEDAFVVIPVRRFSHASREMEQSIPKMYLIDNGFASQLGSRTSENIGRLMENAVATELFRRMSLDPSFEFYYWKDTDGKEVDFVLKEGTALRELIQVCYDVEERDTKDREIKGLIKASRSLDCKALKIITWDHEDKETIGGRTISYVPLWKWLL